MEFKDKTIEELEKYKKNIEQSIKNKKKDCYYEEFLILKQIEKRILELK